MNALKGITALAIIGVIGITSTYAGIIITLTRFKGNDFLLK